MSKKPRASDEPRPDQAADEPQEGDTEGHSFILDPDTSRTIAREREKEIQRNLRDASRRPFFRRGR
jgi:hypothetical protein